MKQAQAQAPNVRFWTYLNQGWVKLTLKQGQTIRHGKAWLTEEGYDSYAREWQHNGDKIGYVYHSAGRDCDGSHSETQYLSNSVPMKFEENEYSPSGMVPDWSRAKPSYCYDQFAQMANY